MVKPAQGGGLKGQSSAAACAMFALCLEPVAFELPTGRHTHTYHTHTNTHTHHDAREALCMSRVFTVHDGLIKSRFSFPFCRFVSLCEIFPSIASDFSEPEKENRIQQTKAKNQKQKSKQKGKQKHTVCILHYMLNEMH